MFTNSLFFEESLLDEPNRSGYIGEKFGQKKNDYVTAGVFYALFSASKENIAGKIVKKEL